MNMPKQNRRKNTAMSMKPVSFSFRERYAAEPTITMPFCMMPHQSCSGSVGSSIMCSSLIANAGKQHRSSMLKSSVVFFMIFFFWFDAANDTRMLCNVNSSLTYIHL